MMMMLMSLRLLLLLLLMMLLFLLMLNHVLLRLSAMLPDETLRSETRFFTGVNQALVLSQVVLALGEILLLRWVNAPPLLARVRDSLDYSKTWLVLLLTLLPVALTMTLLWKTKEVIVASVFRTPP